MSEEIKVRKPILPNFLGFADVATCYDRRWWKWYTSLPNNGDYIKITWFPAARNAPREINAYIGMEGEVTLMDKTDGSFVLKCETCSLIHPQGNFNYIHITTP